VWLHDRFEEIEEYAGYIVSAVDLYRKVFMCFILMLTKCHQFAVGTPVLYLCDHWGRDSGVVTIPLGKQAAPHRM